MLSPAGDLRWRVLVWLYLGGILSANAMTAKLMDLGYGISVTSGAMAIPLVYLTTDLLNELFGPRVTRQVVWMGLGANVVLVVMALLCGAVPASQLGVPQAVFHAMFGITPRVVVASMTAYLLSSMLDVWIFHRLRRLTRERHFWLRKNGSTAVSQLVDTATFMAIAFAGVLPWSAMPGMLLGQYLVKMVAAPLGTPLSYVVLRLVRPSDKGLARALVSDWNDLRGRR